MAGDDPTKKSPASSLAALAITSPTPLNEACRLVLPNKRRATLEAGISAEVAHASLLEGFGIIAGDPDLSVFGVRDSDWSSFTGLHELIPKRLLQQARILNWKFCALAVPGKSTAPAIRFSMVAVAPSAGASETKKGKKDDPVWKLIEEPAFTWLAENGVPVKGDGQLANFERLLAQLLERHKTSSTESNVRAHAHKYMEAYSARNRKGL